MAWLQGYAKQTSGFLGRVTHTIASIVRTGMGQCRGAVHQQKQYTVLQTDLPDDLVQDMLHILFSLIHARLATLLGPGR